MKGQLERRPLRKPLGAKKGDFNMPYGRKVGRLS